VSLYDYYKEALFLEICMFLDKLIYIRPLLEYASNVWSPNLIKHINSLERVQRHFTKRIIKLQDLFYQERLTSLNLETLETAINKFQN